MSKRREILATARRLDNVAEYIEANYMDHGYTKNQAEQFVYRLDTMADQLMEANGIDPQALVDMDENRDAVVMERDQDEAYLDTFNGPSVIEHDDEPYVQEHMNDMTDSELHDPLEGDLPTEASTDYWGEFTEASTDYWNDDVTEASTGDYWDDEPVQAARRDYWDDDFQF